MTASGALTIARRLAKQAVADTRAHVQSCAVCAAWRRTGGGFPCPAGAARIRSQRSALADLELQRRLEVRPDPNQGVLF
jgi:hypothetical protein